MQSTSKLDVVKNKRILILCPYPLGFAPSQRFRFEQYLDALRTNQFDVVVQPFLAPRTMQILYQKGYFFRKIFGTISGFARRLAIVPSALQYDYIYIHREATPVGPPIIEFLLLKLGARIVDDFDDAIFMPHMSAANSLVSFAKWPSKVAFIARHAQKVVVSNTYLRDWAWKLNERTLIIPTTINLTYHHLVPKKSIEQRRIIIGWTGSHSTLKYLELVKPALIRLQSEFDFEFRVICDVNPEFNELRNFVFQPWCVETEIEDLGMIDIGLMPIPDGEWELGKLGLKAIQYSGIEAASVVSGTASSREIVIDGVTGLITENTDDSWHAAISTLLANPSLVVKMGKAARQHIDSEYSVRAHTNDVLQLFTN